MRRRTLPLHAAGLALLVSQACSPPPSPAQILAERAAQLVRDSSAAPSDTVYQRALAKYRHDSRIIDSMTRAARRDVLIQSDSLYKAYRLALRPQRLTEAEVNLLSCLELELIVRYGTVAGERVANELGDTVFRDNGITDHDTALKLFLSRAPDSGVLDSRYCSHIKHGPPVVIDGTRVDDEPSPPSRR